MGVVADLSINPATALVSAPPPSKTEKRREDYAQLFRNRDLRLLRTQGVGFFSGCVSVVGYTYLTPLLTRKFRLQDICGIHNLHGMVRPLENIQIFSLVGQIFSEIFSFAPELPLRFCLRLLPLTPTPLLSPVSSARSSACSPRPFSPAPTPSTTPTIRASSVARSRFVSSLAFVVCRALPFSSRASLSCLGSSCTSFRPACLYSRATCECAEILGSRLTDFSRQPLYQFLTILVTMALAIISGIATGALFWLVEKYIYPRTGSLIYCQTGNILFLGFPFPEFPSLIVFALLVQIELSLSPLQFYISRVLRKRLCYSSFLES